MDFARAGVDEIEVIHVDIGARRTNGHRLARRFRLNRNFSVCTRKSALRSRGECQRIRLDINRTACCRYLARRVEIDRRRFERCRRRARRFDLGIRIELERAARLELHRARRVRHAVCADREIARHVETRAARCCHQPRFTANGQIAAVLKGQALCLAVELIDSVRAREIHGCIRRLKHGRVRRDDARARDGVFRAKSQCVRRSDIHRATDRQRACTRIHFQIFVCRHAICDDIRLFRGIADHILLEVPNLSRARERIAYEVKSARASPKVDGLPIRKRPDLRSACEVAVARDRAREVEGIRAQFDRARRDVPAEGDTLAAARGFADERDLARARRDRRARERYARRVRCRAACKFDIAARRGAVRRVNRDAVECDARFARTLRVGKADAIFDKTAADLDIAAERLDILSGRNADTAARTVVRIGGDVHIEFARRRRDVGIDVDTARCFQGKGRVAARRLRDGIRYGDGVVVRSREVRRLNGYRCAAVQRIGDGLHIRLRAGFRISRCARLDLNIAGID